MAHQASRIVLLVALLIGAQGLALAHDVQHDLACERACLVCNVSPFLDGPMDSGQPSAHTVVLQSVAPTWFSSVPPWLDCQFQPPVRAPPAAP